MAEVEAPQKREPQEADAEAPQKREPQETTKTAVEDTPRKQRRRRLEQAQNPVLPNLPKVSDFLGQVPGQVPSQPPATSMAAPAKVDPNDF